MEYEEGTPFCSNCGGALVTKEAPKPVEQNKEMEEAKPAEKLICPKCHLLYEKLTSCIRCGTPLVTQSAFKEMKESLPPAAPEGKKAESKIAPPSEVKTEPPPVSPPKKPPAELRKGEPQKTHEDMTQKPSSAEPAEKTLRGGFPEERRERAIPSKKQKRNLLQSRLGMLFFIFLILAAVYFTLNPFSGGQLGLGIKRSEKATPSGEDETSTPSREASPAIPSTAIPVVLLPQEIERMKGLLENIRQANLKKDIHLLMSCYASDFKGLEERRRAALESWSKYNYLDLDYTLKANTVSIDSAKVRVKWNMRLIPIKGHYCPEGTSDLDVTLKKEKREWKIDEVVPAK